MINPCFLLEVEKDITYLDIPDVRGSKDFNLASEEFRKQKSLRTADVKFFELAPSVFFTYFESIKFFYYSDV